MEVHVEVNHRDRQLHITKAVPRKKFMRNHDNLMRNHDDLGPEQTCESYYISLLQIIFWLDEEMHDYVLHETCVYKAAAYNLYINVYAWLQSEASRGRAEVK